MVEFICLINGKALENICNLTHALGAFFDYVDKKRCVGRSNMFIFFQLLLGRKSQPRRVGGQKKTKSCQRS